jgi:hypothetical protein
MRDYFNLSSISQDDGEVNTLIPTNENLFPTWEQFIPNLGTKRSQGGNILITIKKIPPLVVSRSGIIIEYIRNLS